MTAAACAIGMVAMLGLSVDLGRMYIVRNEAQTYVDSAALSAALELDGSLTGLQRARDTVAASTNRWHLATAAFAGTQTKFSTAQAGPWDANPASATGVRFVRVWANADPPLYFIPIVTASTRGQVNAAAVAGQVRQTSYREGLFPFSPISHDESDPNYGLTPNQTYTLRWASAPRLHQRVCDGDDDQSIIDRANATGEERGYIEETGASVIRDAIEGDYQTRPLAIDDIVNMSGGSKQTQQDAIVNRVRQDTDFNSRTYAEYIAGGTGNGRRIIVVPINTWNPGYRVVGFATFFLMEPSVYQAANGGNKPFCAEFVQAGYVQGSHHQGAGGTGGYAVRLVQ
jgi:Flp pilus assembly protein TadG